MYGLNKACEDSVLAAACHETLEMEDLEALATCAKSTYSGDVGGDTWIQSKRPSRSSFYLKTGLFLPPDVTLHNMKHYGRRHFLKMRESEMHIYACDPCYEERQIELRPDMRAQLVDWLMEVCANFSVHRRTFQAAVNHCDRYLSLCARGFPKQRLQLLAITALFVAAKMDEVYPPKAHDLAEATAGAFHARDLVNFEQDLLTTLSWNLTPPTPDDWAEWYFLAFLERGLPAATTEMKAASAPSLSQQDLPSLALLQHLPTGIAQKVQVLLDLALLDVTSIHFFPSMLAAAGLYVLLPPVFHPALALATGYPPNDKALEHCKAYLTFLATGLFDSSLPLQALPLSRRHLQHGQPGQRAGGGFGWTPEASEAAQSGVPLWDKHSLQSHPSRLLPHLLGRISAISDHCDDLPPPPPYAPKTQGAQADHPAGDAAALATSSLSPPCSSTSPSASTLPLATRAPAALADLVIPTHAKARLLSPLPSFLGYRSVSSKNLIAGRKGRCDEWEDEEATFMETLEMWPMDESENGEETEEEEGGAEEEEEDEGGAEEEEEGRKGMDEDIFGHSLELHEEWESGRRGRERKAGRCGLGQDEGRGAGPQSLRLEALDGEASENELGWSMATTVDPQTTRDSVFSFFSLEGTEGGQDGGHGPGSGRGSEEMLGWQHEVRERFGEDCTTTQEACDEGEELEEMRNVALSSPCLTPIFCPDEAKVASGLGASATTTAP